MLSRSFTTLYLIRLNNYYCFAKNFLDKIKAKLYKPKNDFLKTENCYHIFIAISFEYFLFLLNQIICLRFSLIFWEKGENVSNNTELLSFLVTFSSFLALYPAFCFELRNEIQCLKKKEFALLENRFILMVFIYAVYLTRKHDYL